MGPRTRFFPAFWEHNRTLRGLYERWRSPLASSRLISNFIVTTARVDRDWQPDEIDLWGFAADQAADATPNFPSIALFAGEKDVLVRKWTFLLTLASTNILPIRGGQIQISKVFDPAYNPVGIGAGEFFAFYTGTRGLQVPEVRCVAGLNASLPAVLIKDVLVNPAIGPRSQMDPGTEFLNSLSVGDFQTIFDWTDPPILLRPFEILYVQFINPVVDSRLWSNIWLTERRSAS